jgi:transglutaminase-like putative cysteine protease
MAVLTVRHTTSYRYRRAVSLGEHRLMFRPRDSYDQRLLDCRLVVTPEPASVRWMHDVFGNCVTVVEFATRTEALEFESTIRLDHSAIEPLDFPIDAHAETYPFSYGAEELPDLLRSIERQYADRSYAIDRWARRFVGRSGTIGTHALLAAITHAIHDDFKYVSRPEMGVQEPARTLKLRSGSCRDLAVLMMEAVRSLGLAARFVSGYLHVREDEYSGGGSTHAWAQIYVPGAGWMEFDPTNGIVGNQDLIRVAVARDPQQAVPIWGTYTGFDSDALPMTVDVEITEDEYAVVHEHDTAPPRRARRAN